MTRHIWQARTNERPARNANLYAVPATFGQDMAAQARWLTQQAFGLGFADLEELLSKTPDAYMRLAATWREHHPLIAA